MHDLKREGIIINVQFSSVQISGVASRICINLCCPEFLYMNKTELQLVTQLCIASLPAQFLSFKLLNGVGVLAGRKDENCRQKCANIDFLL